MTTRKSHENISHQNGDPTERKANLNGEREKLKFFYTRNYACHQPISLSFRWKVLWAVKTTHTHVLDEGKFK